MEKHSNVLSHAAARSAACSSRVFPMPDSPSMITSLGGVDDTTPSQLVRGDDDLTPRCSGTS